MSRGQKFMFGFLFSMVFIGSIGSCCGCSRGEGEVHQTRSQPDTSNRKPDKSGIMIKLCDGSVLRGTSLTDSLILNTQYASVSLPLSLVQSVQLQDTNRTATVSLGNGDRLNGVLLNSTHSIESVLGTMEIPIREVSLISVVPAGVVHDSNLVAWYPFDGNPKDHSGHHRDGTVKGGRLCTDRFGTPNSAYEFDGRGSRVELPDGIIRYDVPEFTMSVWVKTPNLQRREIAVYLGASEGEMFIETFDGQLSFCANTGGAQLRVRTSIPYDTWAHVVGVYRRGASCQIWINGELRSTVSVPDADLEHGYPNHHSAIGSYAPSQFAHAHAHNIGSWLGAIDDVRMYDRALSAEEIRALANE